MRTGSKRPGGREDIRDVSTVVPPTEASLPRPCHGLTEGRPGGQWWSARLFVGVLAHRALPHKRLPYGPRQAGRQRGIGPPACRMALNGEPHPAAPQLLQIPHL